eukprot:1155693-Pelagomonas_calceolata.AAC.1
MKKICTLPASLVLAVVPGKPQSDTTSARSQPGGPASSSSTSTESSRHRKKSNRQRDLILGLVLGLGGGILLLAITLGALRRAWAKRYHARVMKEMRMVPQGTTGASLELNAQPPQSPHSPNTGFFPPLPTSKRALSLTSRPGAFICQDKPQDADVNSSSFREQQVSKSCMLDN